MTLVKHLIHSLRGRNPEAQVFLMTERRQPHENYLAGVVGRQEMADQRCRIEPGVGTDDVFLVVGKRIRPGSLSAWLVAEEQEARVIADCHTREPGWQAELTQIARVQLGVDTLKTQGRIGLDVYRLEVGSLRAALTAAYRAGIAAGIRHTVAGDPDVEPAPTASTEAPVTGSEEAPVTALEAPVTASEEALVTAPEAQETASYDAEAAHHADASTI